MVCVCEDEYIALSDCVCDCESVSVYMFVRLRGYVNWVYVNV